MVRLVGTDDSVKSPAAAACTTSVTVALWTSEPLVPVTVTVYVPAGVDASVDTLIVEAPDPPGTGFGLNDAEAPAGSPDAESVTALENPLSDPIVAV